MNGLIIRSPYIELILNGKKTWEIRGHSTKIRGKIALIRGGSGLVVGTCEMTGAIGPLTLGELRKNAAKAGFKKNEIKELPYQNTYAWVVRRVRKLNRPRRYKHPSGAVIWVRLTSARMSR